MMKRRAEKKDKPKRSVLRRAAKTVAAAVQARVASTPEPAVDHANDLQEPECAQAQRAHERIGALRDYVVGKLDGLTDRVTLAIKKRDTAVTNLAVAMVVCGIFLFGAVLALDHKESKVAASEAAVEAAESADHFEVALAMRRADAAERVAKANAQALDAMRKSMRDTSRLAVCANDALEDPCGALR